MFHSVGVSFDSLQIRNDSIFSSCSQVLHSFIFVFATCPIFFSLNLALAGTEFCSASLLNWFFFTFRVPDSVVINGEIFLLVLHSVVCARVILLVLAPLRSKWEENMYRWQQLHLNQVLTSVKKISAVSPAKQFASAFSWLNLFHSTSTSNLSSLSFIV
jgi:hypothetical protein